MPYLTEQIRIINEGLKSNALSDVRFANGYFGGLAEEVTERDAERGDRRYPVVITEPSNDPVKVSIDDKYPFFMYHKQGVSTLGVPAGNDYGDVSKAVLETQDMHLIVYAKRKRIKLLKDQLASLITLAMPTNVPKDTLRGTTKLDRMTVEVVSKDMDASAVFGSEYINVKQFIGADDILFRINYTIITQYRKGCFDLCDCIPQ